MTSYLSTVKEKASHDRRQRCSLIITVATQIKDTDLQPNRRKACCDKCFPAPPWPQSNRSLDCYSHRLVPPGLKLSGANYHRVCPLLCLVLSICQREQSPCSEGSGGWPSMADNTPCHPMLLSVLRSWGRGWLPVLTLDSVGERLLSTACPLGSRI